MAETHTDQPASDLAATAPPDGSPPRLRAASACVACNMKKIRCVFPDHRKECVNCIRNNWECTPRERKRKRRKLAQPDQDNAIPAVADIRDPSRPSPSQHQSTWDSRFFGWDQPARPPVPEHRQSIISGHSPTAPPPIAGAQFPKSSTSTTDDTPNSTLHRQQGAGPPSYEPSPAESSFLGRSEYIGGDVPINEDQAKSYPAVPTESLSQEDIHMLQLQHAFDLPPRAVREGLIDAFMKRCAPWMPIVERSWLAERYGSQPSILLLQAVFLAGSRVSSAPTVAAYASSHEFYRRAKALFWSGYEKNTITVITAVCIMHWYNPEGPEHVSINTSGFWNRIGVGLAYQIGLHKEPTHGRDAPLRRRLWWTLFARDCLISAGHGRPRATNLDDCDVRPLTCEDFYGSSSDGALFMAYVELACLLGELTQSSCRKYLSRQKRRYIENSLYRWSRELPEYLQLFRRVPTDASPNGKLVLVPYNFEGRQLHVIYFIIIAILFRAQPPAKAPSTAALLASSYVAGIFEDFLARDEIRFLGPIFTFYLLAAGVGLLSCIRYPNVWGRAEQDLNIIYNSQRELSKRWPSAIGSWNALHNMAEEANKIPRQKETLPLSALTPDQQAYFSGLGTDLCRLGDAIMGPQSNELLDPRRTEDEPYSRSASDMMTAGILAELKTPISTPAALDGYLPLATVVEPNSHPAGGERGEPTDVAADDLLGNQYEGIGNWLLRDLGWNSDIIW